MIKFTEDEAKAYFASRNMTLERSWDDTWRIRFQGGDTFYQRYATLEGAITGRLAPHRDRKLAAQAFEKWLVQHRMGVQ